MKKNCFVGFDTSNYTTSVALCDEAGRIVANLRTPLPVAMGERGLRQSDAVFAHIKNLPELCDKLGEILRDEEYEVCAVGVSSRPRSTPGSYMPCFLSGVAAARSFASAAGVGVSEFSHQEGHVMAALYSSGQTERLLACERFLAFHVSGGTTEALLGSTSASTLSDGENRPFSLTLVGETGDLNAGQVIDRAGVMMGMKFPCGAELEGLASSYAGAVPSYRVSVREDGDKIACNLSGVENQAKKLYEKSSDRSLVAAFVFECVCKTLYAMAEELTKKYGELPIIFSGGVMSNKLMRGRLSSRFDASFAEPAFSADNATGIALLCRNKYLADRGK